MSNVQKTYTLEEVVKLVESCLTTEKVVMAYQAKTTDSFYVCLEDVLSPKTSLYKIIRLSTHEARLNHLYETIDLDSPSVKCMIYQAIYKENSWTSLKPSRFLLLRLFDEFCSNHFEFFALYNSSWSKSKGVYVLQKKRGFRHFLHNKHEKELMVLVRAGFISRKKNKLFLTQSGKEVLVKEKNRKDRAALWRESFGENLFDFNELENNKEFFFKSKKVTKNKKAGRKNGRNKRIVA